MDFQKTVVLIFIACGVQTFCLPLPKYVTPCSLRDPQLNECIRKSAQAGIRSIAGGDPEYNVPAIDPLRVGELGIEQGIGAVSIKLKFKDFDIIGLLESRVNKVRTDLKARWIELDLTLPTFKILGPYKINGKVLLLPILGEGQSNVTCRKHMNGFINENWNVILDDLRPAIEEMFSQLAEYIFSQIIKNVPYDQVFLDK